MQGYRRGAVATVVLIVLGAAGVWVSGPFEGAPGSPPTPGRKVANGMHGARKCSLGFAFGLRCRGSAAATPTTTSPTSRWERWRATVRTTRSFLLQTWAA